MSHKRTSNWPSKLAEFLELRRDKPFDIEHNNCAFFVADWMIVLVGEDFAANYRNLSKRELAALHMDHGYAALISSIMGSNGFVESTAFYARRGDIVEGTFDGRTVLGICDGAYSAFVSVNGLLFVTTGSCSRAWRIA